MAFTEPYSVNDNSATLQSFTRTGSLPTGSDWVENDATSSNRRSMKVRHSNVAASKTPGGKPVRRHLLQFVHEKWNATINKWESATINVTLTVDPQSSITAAEIYDLMAFEKNSLTTTIVDKLIRDET